MDRPFVVSDWKPTKPFKPSEKGYTKEKVRELFNERATNTKHILHHPYDAVSWIQRARTHTSLRYPELAVGDGLKARLLCKELLAVLQSNSRPNYRLGANAAFWMRHEDPEDEYEYCEVPAGLVGDIGRDLDDEHDLQIGTFDALMSVADKVVAENLEFYPHTEVGRYTPQAYPWLEEKHTWRTPDVIDQVNREFNSSADSACIAKRDAFGKGPDGTNVLGVFATRDVEPGEIVLTENSKIFGCHGPSQADVDAGVVWPVENCGTATLHKADGCDDVLHPNDKDDELEHDLRWIRDRAGAEAPHIIMTARILLSCVQDGVAHPLDHPYIVRLTPHYRDGITQDFNLESNFNIFITALQQFGIDIFANHNFDTWVLFTVEARAINNAWSNQISFCLSPLFSLFNHSCAPNLNWQSHSDHRTLDLVALKPIKKGEQMFVMYDADPKGNKRSLHERRQKLLQWLDHECNCPRCIEEERYEKEVEELYNQPLKYMPGSDHDDGEVRSRAMLDFNDRPSQWDTSEPAELPEDEVEGGKWELVKKRTKRFKAKEASTKHQKQKSGGGPGGKGKKSSKLARKDSMMF